MERANELFNWLTGRTPKKSSKKEGFSKKLKENEKVTKKTMTTMKTTKSITIMGTNGKEKTAEPVQQAPPMNPFQAKTSPQLAFAPPPGATPVRVNVYEQKALKEKLHSFGITGIGIFHSGLEVHGMEWCYGGHPSDSSGIYKMAKPRDLKSLSENFNSQFEYRQTLRLGYTEKTLEQVISLVWGGGAFWSGSICLIPTPFSPLFPSFSDWLRDGRAISIIFSTRIAITLQMPSPSHSLWSWSTCVD